MKHARKLNASANIQGRRVDLAWQNPPAREFDPLDSVARIHVVRQRHTFPEAVDDGERVYEGPAINRLSDTNVTPLETHYYKVFVENTLGEIFSEDESAACAFATQDYKLAEKLYRQLPAVHQRYDTALDDHALEELAANFPVLFDRFQALPSEQRNLGQLRRMFAFLALPFDALRSLAEGLPQIHNIGRARHDVLSNLSFWLGWDLDESLPVYSQRNEVRFAPHRYQSVGTHASLADFVHRYTGWVTQAVEMQALLTRANVPDALNIFAVRQQGAQWIGTDDASALLGFGPGNDTAAGAPAVSASLIGNTIEPFALRPNMELAVTVDHSVPSVVRFRSGDFADIGAATAAEVAVAFTANQSQATAVARVDGRLVLTSHTLGENSAIDVEHTATSLVALENAPKGRLATAAYTDEFGDPRTRLFYETADPTEAVQDWASRRHLDGFEELTASDREAGGEIPRRASPTAVVSAENRSVSRLMYKTFRHGAWGDSFPVPNATPNPQDSPAVVELPGHPAAVLLAWIERPGSGEERIQIRVGAPIPAAPARLTGEIAEPFSIELQSQLVMSGSWPEPAVFHFVAGDFADPSQATAAEVEAALNTRLSDVTATALANNTILLETNQVGGDQRIRMDLVRSGAATAIGFGGENHDASGDWGDDMRWSEPRLVDSLGPGRYRDLHLVVDNLDTIWLFCARYGNRNWEVVATRFSGWAWLPPNLVGGAWSAPDVLASGLFGNREPYAVLDDLNRLWLIWSRKTAGNPSLEQWTLRSRRFDGLSGTWGAEQAVTNAPAGVQISDRQPSAVSRLPGMLEISFRSDRNGGADLFSVDLNIATGVASVPGTVLSGATGDHNPEPILMAGGERWLLYRSDRSVPLAHVGTRDIPEFENRHTFTDSEPDAATTYIEGSVNSKATGTARRYAGISTVDLRDAARITLGQSRSYNDMLSYTPQRPLGDLQEAPPGSDEPFTRGTVRLYVSRLTPESPLTEARVQRVKSVLERFIPINVRVLFAIAPRVNIEYVYRDPLSGRDLEDSYLDRYPFIETFGDIVDDTAIVAPDWRILLSNTLGDVSAEVADPTTLRGRTFTPLLRP